MSYGFVFPKRGYDTDTAVKNLAWRDDQQVFLARDRQTRIVTVLSGYDLNGHYYDLPVSVGTWDYYVYHAYLSVTYGSNSRTMLADGTQVISAGGRQFLLETQFLQSSETTGIVRFWFHKLNNGQVTANTTLTFSAYVCLQTITSNSVSGGEADSGAYGLKVSLPGYNVATCNPKQCSLHSEFTALKARTIGSIHLTNGQWTKITHDYGYEPAYYGYFTGSFGGQSGISTFGGVRNMSSNLEEDARLESYVTTDSLWLYATQSCTVYYYIFADQAGSALSNSNIPDDDYGKYGLIITKPGSDIRTAKPNQLRFCSAYPNFKVHSEVVHAGTAITTDTKLTSNCGDSDTTINMTNANKFGDKGKFVLAKLEESILQDWHWTSAIEPARMLNWDSMAEEKTKIIIHAEGGVFEGTYEHGNFSGDARWTGDGGSRRYQFYKAGSWQTIDTGWTEGYCSMWNGFWTWYRGDSEWVEVYLGGIENWGCWFNLGKWTEIKTFYQEIVTFTGSNDTQFTGCSRGQDGTSARGWDTDTLVIPIEMIFNVANNPFTYNPAFMGWTIGPYEADGARVIPTGSGNESFNIGLISNRFYYIAKRGYRGENDPWFNGGLPFTVPGCYVKIFYDEIGT